MRDSVLLVGYHPSVLGGVTTIMTLLMENIPYLHLHVALRCYHPRWRAALYSLYSLSSFVCKLLCCPSRVVQVVVGSRGDAVRTLPFVVLSRLRGCRVCLHFHKNNAALLDGLPSFGRRLVLFVWRRADAYCFLSDCLRAEFATYFDPRKPQVVIPNPISEQWLRGLSIPLQRRSRDLVFLGRWSPEKGVRELVSVMQQIDVGWPVHCDIYSDHGGADGPPNCRFHNWLNEHGVKQVLSEAKVLVLPSHAEAFPTVLLEAAACGTPFVSTRIAGIPDIAEQSQAGILHDVGDVDGMRQAVSHLLTEDRVWSECSQNGRRWVASLEVSKIVPLWHSLYATLGIRQPERK